VVSSLAGGSTLTRPSPAPDRPGTWRCPCGAEHQAAVSYCPECDTTSPGSLLGALLPRPPADGPTARSRWFDRRPPTALVVAVAVLVFAVGAAAVAQAWRAGPTRPRDDLVELSGSGPRGRDALVRRLAVYVERARGLRFARPVKVAAVDPATFQAHLRSGTLLDLADAQEETATLRALGLASGDGDRAARSEGRVAAAVGAYDLVTRQVYLRGDLPVTPYLGFVLVHELTHALQDQHFDLSRPYGDSTDAVRAAVSLVEGDAERVARSYLEALPPASLDAVQRESQTRGDELYRGLYLQSADTFPYIVGESFVRQLLESGGQARLDAAFRYYPTSTEQVLHPERYLAGDQPMAVAEPRAGGPVVERGVIGEFDLVSVLWHGGVAVPAAVRAAEGWGGARFVTWLDRGRACTRVRILMDTPADTVTLSAALHEWIAHRSASLAGSGSLVLTACG